jgi:uncharacterized protein
MTRGWRWLSCVLTLSLLVAGVGLAEEEPVSFHKGTISPPPRRHSLKELRDQYVVKQQLDYSCGAAALATLMTYYFGEKTEEREIIQVLAAPFTKDELKLKEQRGFSLLDLKRVANTKGYQAAGFKLTLEQLQHLAAPVIVYVRPLGYNHFAVLRGIDRGRVFLADPSRGNLRMSVGRFLSEWDGTVFVLGKPGEEAITTYPLALQRPDSVRPELFRVGRLPDSQAFTVDWAVRAHSR